MRNIISAYLFVHVTVDESKGEIRYQNDKNSRILMLDNLASHGGYQLFDTLPKVNVKDVKF